MHVLYSFTSAISGVGVGNWQEPIRPSPVPRKLGRLCETSMICKPVAMFHYLKPSFLIKKITELKAILSPTYRQTYFSVHVINPVDS